VGDSDFEVQYVGSFNIVRFAQHSYRILGQEWSVTRSNAFVCSYTNVYSVITK